MSDHLDPDDLDPDEAEQHGDVPDPDDVLTPTQLSALRDALAHEPIEVDAGLREQHVLAALASLDTDEDVVIDLGAASARRADTSPYATPRRHPWRTVLVAASVVAVAGLGVLALNVSGDSIDMAGSGDDSAESGTAGDELTPTAGSPEDSAGDLDAGAGGGSVAPTTTSATAEAPEAAPASSLPDLGAYPDVASLLAARPADGLDRAARDEAFTDGRSLPPDGAACLYQEALSGSTLLGLALVRGTETLVVDRGGVVVVVTLEDCTELRE